MKPHGNPERYPRWDAPSRPTPEGGNRMQVSEVFTSGMTRTGHDGHGDHDRNRNHRRGHQHHRGHWAWDRRNRRRYWCWDD